MKEIALSFLILFIANSLNAQVKIARPSSQQKTEQVVGLTNIKVKYSRPNVKGKKNIWRISSF